MDGSVFLKAERQMFILLIQKLHGQVMGSQKQYCKFQANVLLSSSENAEYLKNANATTHFKTIDNEFMKSVQANKENMKKIMQTLKPCKNTPKTSLNAF